VVLGAHICYMTANGAIHTTMGAGSGLVTIAAVMAASSSSVSPAWRLQMLVANPIVIRISSFSRFDDG
jgi:hypothetical protein